MRVKQFQAVRKDGTDNIRSGTPVTSSCGKVTKGARNYGQLTVRKVAEEANIYKKQ
jgi:hypothetical protein